MPQCNNCRYRFRTLEGEEQDHDCPRCGWHPSQDICQTCSGSGRVIVENEWFLDRGTKWQRRCREQVNDDCPDCDGTGLAYEVNE